MKEQNSEKKKKQKMVSVDPSDFFSRELPPVQQSEPVVKHEIFPSEWKHEYTESGTLPKTFGGLMYHYCWVGLWDAGQSRNDMMSQAKHELEKICSDDTQIADAISIADQWLEKAREIYARAIKRKEDTPEELAEIKAMKGPLFYSIEVKRKKQANYEEKIKIIGKPVGKNPPAPPHDELRRIPPIPNHDIQRPVLMQCSHINEISSLQPAKIWELYVDESGKDDAFETQGRGVIAGVLTTPENPLPPCTGLHASTDADEEKIVAADKAIETLIHHEQCGVLCLPVKAYSTANGWASMIASLIDLVLRMLPLPPGKETVKLNIFVENRSIYSKNADFIFLRDACKYNLMHSYSDRASRIQFEINVMTKKCPYDSYPDIVANTCYCSHGRLQSRRLSAAGWDRTCFINYPADQMKDVWDCYYHGQIFSPERWNSIVLASSGNDIGLLGAISKAIGEEVRNDVNLWKSYLDFVVAHLSSKAINLRELKYQINWLKSYSPENEILPPRLKLLWLTARLAESNHVGIVEQQNNSEYAEFRSLMEQLYEEDAPLVCWAVLHLAVAETNSFRFAEAKKIVTEFSDIGSLLSKDPPFTRLIKLAVRTIIGPDTPDNYVPAAIPGLRYYGQLLSSCGQHEAFLGNNEKAIIYFKEAIKCFERLSEDGDKEIGQTRAYLVTALMDMNPNSSDTFAELWKYLCGMPKQTVRNVPADDNVPSDMMLNDIKQFIPMLAGDNSSDWKYHHHILLRYLINSGNRELTDAYLACESQWKHESGHPWEMIEFYRGMLFENTEKRLEYFRKGYEIAVSGGATLRVIASVILGAIYCYDQTVQEELKQLADTVIKELPALGDSRRDTLSKQVGEPLSPLELAEAILPFNFR